MNTSTTKNQPAYSNRFPPYQIDFSASSSGKRVSSTKRRIRWRFGFVNSESISTGKTSTDCRGEEHEVQIIWSITSGKRVIIFDDMEEHCSVGRRDTKFEYSWGWRSCHTFKIIAYATAPLTKKANFRQFELILDGKSFFDFANIYELGMSVDAECIPDGSYLSQQNSLQLSSSGEKMNQNQGDEDIPCNENKNASIASLQFDGLGDESTDLLSGPSLSFDTMASTSRCSFDEFNPVQTSTSFESISTEILSYYTVDKCPALASQSDCVPVTMAGSNQSQSSLKLTQCDAKSVGTNEVSPLSVQITNETLSNSVSETEKFTFEAIKYGNANGNKIVLPHQENAEPAYTSDLNTAMTKLVNLEDINEIKEPIMLTMESHNALGKNKNSTSRGIPPKTAPWYANQSLGEIQALKKMAPMKQLVMKPPTSADANVGAILVHRNGQSNSYTSPPSMLNTGYSVEAQTKYHQRTQTHNMNYCQ